MNNRNRFARGLIVGSLIGATIGMMNKGQTYGWQRKMMRAGRNAFSRRNGLMSIISDLF